MGLLQKNVSGDIWYRNHHISTYIKSIHMLIGTYKMKVWHKVTLSFSSFKNSSSKVLMNILNVHCEDSWLGKFNFFSCKLISFVNWDIYFSVGNMKTFSLTKLIILSLMWRNLSIFLYFYYRFLMNFINIFSFRAFEIRSVLWPSEWRNIISIYRRRNQLSD